jgi:hypothetical protein
MKQIKTMAKKLTKENLKTEKNLNLTEEEQEQYLTYVKNYYGEVHYHVYEGAVLIEQSGNPKPPPPYGGGG